MRFNYQRSCVWIVEEFKKSRVQIVEEYYKKIMAESPEGKMQPEEFKKIFQ